MNRDAIAPLYDVKQAVLQQQTLDLRDANARLDMLQKERDALLEAMARDDSDGSVETALAIQRYRAFQKQALGKLDEKIIVATRDSKAAEETLSETFAEVRAIEKLMEGV